MVDLNSPKDIHKVWWTSGLWIKKGTSLDKERTLNWLVVKKDRFVQETTFHLWSQIKCFHYSTWSSELPLIHRHYQMLATAHI